MTTDTRKIGYSILLILSGMLVLSACTPRVASIISEEGFVTSDADPAAIISGIPFYNAEIHTIDGRARARVSGPDYSDQATVSFTSDRQQSLLAIRNNLGIEGGRIYTDRDSVIIYDRIEQYAWKMSVEKSQEILLNGFAAFNLLDFLIPEIHAGQVERVYQNDELWLLVLDDNRRFFIERRSGKITGITIPASNPSAFNRFLFSAHAGISGVDLPRRIQILSNDEKSNIFLLLQSLETNPSNPSFEINIPDGTPIERR